MRGKSKPSPFPFVEETAKNFKLHPAERSVIFVKNIYTYASNPF